MDNSLAATKHPLVGVASFDPHAGLVGGDDLGLSQRRDGDVAARPRRHLANGGAFARWLGTCVRGTETILFEYDGAWLVDPDRFSLEPALALTCGPFAPPAGLATFGPIGHIPPAEAEANYYAATHDLDMVA
jgi:hypothetical protein